MASCIDHGQKGDRDGYGRCTFKGNHNFFLHRRVFLRQYGHLPAVVRHKCDNPRCINPEHLEVGTNKDNVSDRVARGRNLKANPTKRSLTAEQAADIRARPRPTKRGCKERGACVVAREFGVAPIVVYRIWRGETYYA